MAEEYSFAGGCSCGRLRYGTRGRPFDTGYCHCRICQRTSGAPLLAWASFPVEAFEYSQGAPGVYRSSPHGQREFCSSCGTQIAYRESEGAASVDVNLASLDDPESLPPQYHVWTKSRISWFDTADDLPRYEDAGPDRPST